ncbi:methyl-accepting chemotaxis protein [Desulfopila sp. IMCC35008]|uniref:methyl-accepting chemotaxis protein n=1 Tax=Desulfopila sp. IMCC35008 TaxID=2653858 RepID=UPI0013D3098C|nr:methyl-accepting chemotaxis protein [Desulfopila sp. IMCC35008]
MGQEHKRRKLFINKRYQGRLLAISLLFVLGGCLLFIGIFSAFFSDVLTVSYTENNIQLSQTPAELLKNIVIQNWLIISIAILAVLLLATLLSHRVAGPLYRFERTLELMHQGYLNYTIHLREKDEGQELANKINEFNYQLSLTLRTVANSSAAIGSLIEQAQQLELEEETKEELASLCWSLGAHNRKISRACNSYRLQDKDMSP